MAKLTQQDLTLYFNILAGKLAGHIIRFKLTSAYIIRILRAGRLAGEEARCSAALLRRN
jgi:hypothetical protein